MTHLPPALAAMGAYRQWMVYLAVPKANGKTDKFPCDFRTGQVVSAHDEQYWTNAETAIGAAANLGPNYGAAFTFTRTDPFWFLDIDNAYDVVSGRWSDLATSLCSLFFGCAIEVSRSGTGLHIFGTGNAPAHGCRNGQLGLEFYTESRFVAITGTHIQGDSARDASAVLPSFVATYFPARASDVRDGDVWTSDPVAEWRGPNDDTVLIERATRSKSAQSVFGSRASFADLWYRIEPSLLAAFPDGAGGVDESRADAALAQHLSFWTGCNCERIERLMQQSKLAREKWERADGQYGTYLRRTIATAVSIQSEVLQDKQLELPTVGHVPTPVEVGQPAPSKRPKITAVTGQTFANIDAQMQLFDGCVYVTDEHKIMVPTGELLKPETFKVRYGGYTFQMDLTNQKVSRDAWEAATQNQGYRLPQVNTTLFAPELAPGEVTEVNGVTAVNTYRHVHIARSVGGVTPFLNHLRLLLPDERDREILLSYLCAVVQHPGVKFQWAPLIQGAEGNGKTLFSRCVSEAVGEIYSHWPRADKLANGFNRWMQDKVVICVEDIHVPGSRVDILNILKPMITGEKAEIEAKGKDQLTKRICANFIFNSNHRDAIPVTIDSRRFALFFTAQQNKDDVMRDGMGGNYFPNLYNWLRVGGGYAAVNELLHTRPIYPEFNPAGAAGRAPTTSTTHLAVAYSRGMLAQEIEEWIVQQYDGFRGGWVSSVMLEQRVADSGLRKVSHTRIREVLEGLGYLEHQALHEGRCPVIVMPDGKRPKLYVLKSSPLANLADPMAVANEYQKANSTWKQTT